MQALAAATGPALLSPAAAAGGARQRQRCLRVAADKGFSGGQGQRLPKQVKVRAPQLLNVLVCWSAAVPKGGLRFGPAAASACGTPPFGSP